MTNQWRIYVDNIRTDRPLGGVRVDLYRALCRAGTQVAALIGGDSNVYIENDNLENGRAVNHAKVSVKAGYESHLLDHLLSKDETEILRTFCEVAAPGRVPIFGSLSHYGASSDSQHKLTSFNFDQEMKETESRRMEFKTGGGHYARNRLKSDVGKYTGAFLNSEGGMLIIGVTDAGEILEGSGTSVGVN